MDPVSIGLTVAGAAVTAYGKYQAGQAAAAADTYKAQVAAVNEQIAKDNAAYAIKAGELDAQTAGMKERAEVGTTIAQQGAGGLAIGQGSQAAVVQSEREIGAENVAVVRSNAAKRAYGYEVEAMQATAQGQLDTMAASQDQTAGDIGAAGSLIAGAGSVASKWDQAKQIGLPISTGKSFVD